MWSQRKIKILVSTGSTAATQLVLLSTLASSFSSVIFFKALDIVI
jgi:hypothetical protein